MASFIGRVSKPKCSAINNESKKFPSVPVANELDSHADTCVAGPNMRVIEYLDKYCDVSPFSPEYKAQMDMPVANWATAYHCPVTNELFILIFNQTLYFGDQVNCAYICPNQ
jgi:hypothetical protein